jgi:hypothetical protein
MAAFAVPVDARCPLCGTSILSVGRGGRILSDDAHPVSIYANKSCEGFVLCDDCGLLAELPTDLTLN